jgi:hypothetical protein
MKRGTLIGIAFFAFLLLPAWAAKSASQQSRIVWVGFILFFAFIGGIANLAYRASPAAVTWQPGPYARRYRFVFLAVVGFSFLTAELLAIAITYSEPGIGIVGRSRDFISGIGATLFPVIGKLATAIEPPLPPDVLFRVQAIMSTFMLASIPSLIAAAAYFLGMPDTERRDLHAASPRKRPSDAMVLLCAAFALAMSPAAIFGWLDFSSHPTDKCLMRASCYARGDDLLIFVAASMKVLAFALPLGALMLADANRILPRPDANQ